ncbi:MAG TPA: TlpA disulfide reductase family protein [Terriglobales bacterium]|nr:TlpA disulfide reductase family protein [Terriglobales bacterium]
MANNLTGDFDIVAQFALPAVNRVLAAMHQCERFLHSISVRVDDNPHPGHTHVGPTVVGVVDAFGDPIADHRSIGLPAPVSGASIGSDPAISRLGVVVNADMLTSVIAPPVPSHIEGVAQLQIFPPTVETSGPNLTARMNVMARFFPDKGTAPLAQFIRGDLTITAPISRVASGRVHVLDIDFKAEDAVINFVPSYSSETLSAEDLAGISLCIQNGLRTSFLPSSVVLPSSIADVQLKTLPGAVALLLDLNAHTPASRPASVTNVFLGGEDDFAFAIGREFILSLFQSTVSSITQFQPFNVHVAVWGTTTYTITLTSPPALALQPGAIVLTIRAHAHSSKDRFPSFNFTTTVSFTLNLVATGEGGLNAAELALAGVAVDFTDSGLGGWIKDQIVGAFSGRITSQISAQVDDILNPPNPQPGDLQPAIRQMTNADANLGDYLTAQMVPSDGSSQTPGQHVFLVYNSFDISADGVVLHGSVLLFDWPPAHVEFEPIPTHRTGHVHPAGSGPDYSALKSWIPGGTIDRYEWNYQGQPNPFLVDANKFVLLSSGPIATGTMFMAMGAVSAYTPLCLTIRGTRLSNFGSVVPQSVSGTACGFTRFPVVVAGAVATAGTALPMLMVTHAGPGGEVAVGGHTLAQTAERGSAAPNLLVHFADAKSATALEILTDALLESKRNDTATAIIAVVSPDQLAKTRYTSGIVYADDRDGAWERALGLKTAARPLTVIVNPKGTVVWQKEGLPDRETLSASLARYLAASGPIRLSMPRLNVRAGQPAPIFLFELSPGREMPLNKLRGQTVALVFWRSASRPSIEAVRDLRAGKGLVLAINDGESPEVARAVAAESGFSDALVTDPNREISSAYGVEIWPTIVRLDASGAISSIRYGYHTHEHPAAGEKFAAR